MMWRITGTIGGERVDLVARREDSSPPNEPGVGPEFHHEGVFFRATAQNPVLRLATNPEPATYAGVEASFRFHYNGLNPANRQGRHNVCWFARNGNGDLLLYLMVVRNRFRFVHGVGMQHGDKHRLEGAFREPFGWYRVAYSYGGGKVRVELSEDGTGRVIGSWEDVADVAEIEASADDDFWWDFGFTGEKENEPASLGWEFADLQVRFVRQGGVWLQSFSRGAS